MIKRLLVRYQDQIADWLTYTFDPWCVDRGCTSFIGREGEPYLDRYYVLRSKRFSVFVHRFWQSDEAGLHAHPWHNISIPLVGGYIEEHHDGTIDWREPGDIIFRSARELHRVRLPDEGEPDLRPCWSLFIKFRRTRDWGFIKNADLGWERAGHAASKDEFQGRVFPRAKDPYREQYASRS